MGKILLFLVVLFVALFVMRLVNPRTRVKKSDTPRESKQDRLRSEPMVACAKCAALVPQSEVVLSGGKSYCSPAHASESR